MVAIHHGDALDVLATFPDNSVDAVVTDPPYGLANTTPAQVAETLIRWTTDDRAYTPKGRGFMGNEWDAFVPPPALWDEVYRVLKPGGHAAVFAGSRTQDLMGMSLRLAGFDVRDGIAWLHAQGMPKGKHQLKPANEPVLLVRKPFRGSMAANIDEHGTGGLNIDEARIPADVGYHALAVPMPAQGNGDVYGTKYGTGRNGDTFKPATGRWPANVILDEDAAAELDEQSGVTGAKPRTGKRTGKAPGIYGEFTGQDAARKDLGDEGGASRFYYVAKAPKAERPVIDGVAHPTVKPLTLIRHLVKLVVPAGGVVLDPFAGTGTTGEAAMVEGRDFILIENHAPYFPHIDARLDRAVAYA